MHQNIVREKKGFPALHLALHICFLLMRALLSTAPLLSSVFLRFSRAPAPPGRAAARRPLARASAQHTRAKRPDSEAFAMSAAAPSVAMLPALKDLWGYGAFRAGQARPERFQSGVLFAGP